MTTSDFTYNLLIVLALLAYILQFFIDFSAINLASASIVLTSAIITLSYLRYSGAFKNHPLSSFAIFGFNFTSQLGALLAQSFLWTSLSQDLRQPVETFATLFGYQIIGLLAHSFYRVLTKQKDKAKLGAVSSLLKSIGVYQTPTPAQLWIMGLVGMLSMVLGHSGQDVGNKVASGIQFIAWAPFLIPIYIAREGSSYARGKQQFILLGFYLALIALFALAVNARSIMLTGVITVVLIFLIESFRNKAGINKTLIFRGVILLGVGLALSLPVSDLSTAMVIARSIRGKESTTPQKMIEETLYTLGNRDLIKEYRIKQKEAILYTGYDEKYIQNPMLARLIETKFHDNALYFSQNLTDGSKDEVINRTNDFFWYILPEPVLKWLKVNIDKKSMQYSMGDLIYHEAGVAPLGSFDTGSIFGQGYIIAGYFFPIIYFLMCFVIFYFKDLLSFANQKGGKNISALGFLMIWPTFIYGVTGESINVIFSGIVRGFPQTILLFLLVYYFAVVVTSLPRFIILDFKKNSSSKQIYR